jgi:hypothetical protein
VTSYSGKVSSSSGRGLSPEIRVEGLEETLAALRALEPDLLKRMNKRIRAALTKVGARADARLPRGKKAGRRYTIRTSSRGKRTGMRLVATDKYAAMFEFAGTKGLSRTGGPITAQGAAMVKWLDRDFGKPGRFLWDAWDKDKAGFEREMRTAIDEAEHELQRHLDAAGEAY